MTSNKDNTAAAGGSVEEAAEEAGTEAKASEAATEEAAEVSRDAASDNTAEVDAALSGDVDEILAGMTLEEKVGQLMIASFRIWKDVQAEGATQDVKTVENTKSEVPEQNVTELNDLMKESLEKHHFGGFLLFAENYEDSEQVLKLISDIQTSNQKGSKIPLLVATDQEGGVVSRVNFGTAGPGNMTLAATDNVENAKKMASVYGEELSALGVTTDFAPVVDINNNPNNPVIGVRSFSDDPEIVSEYALSYMEGLAESGTIATLKHFPGHGNTDTDSHTGFPSIQSTYDELKKTELIPFQKGIDAGVDMIMTAHIQYPEIETNTYTSTSTGEKIYLPATMSHKIITEILREDMGYDGVVVADALDMAAISDNFSIEDTLCMSINAGVDMLIMPPVKDTEIFERLEKMADSAVELAKEGKIDPDCIDASVRRILTLKKKYGILDNTDFTVTDEQIKKAKETVGSKEHRQIASEIAEQALTLVKNDNKAFPVKLEKDQKALIMTANSAAIRAANADLAKQILEENGLIPEGAEIETLLSTDENEKECLEAAEKADHVILVSRAFNAASMDPDTSDGFSTGVFDKVIEKCHADGKKVIVVSAQLPYDAARFTDADAVLLAYNSANMEKIPPETGKGSAYAPNLAVALCACFDDKECKGKLPVNIPELDGQYHITDKILYKSQIK
ncbi:MAG: glycoside hydrolase family 3 protein [Lachnospiraceae bacterium]|nr:glycoside hydrolase family 3 protein [Lachnospiraceae bacterium]